MQFLNKMNALIAITRIKKPIGILLLLWPTCWGLWLAAQGFPPLKILLIFISGVIVMRSAGCIINDIADRHFDGKVDRTQDRPLATKQLSVLTALIAFAVLSLLGLFLVLQLNGQTILLAIIALVLAIIYPFMKRVMPIPQLILGLAWYIGILMAFTAILGHLSLLAWLLYLSAVIWSIIYDSMYAMCDRADDIKLGLKSSAILFGKFDKIILAFLQLLMLLLLVYIGRYQHLTWPYYVGLLLAAAFFVYQQYLIKDRLPKHCFKAFLNNHWVGCSIFLGIFFATWNGVWLNLI